MTLKAGEVLFIPAGTAHAVRNVGSGKATELATYIVEKGKPLLVAEQVSTASARDEEHATQASTLSDIKESTMTTHKESRTTATETRERGRST